MNIKFSVLNWQSTSPAGNQQQLHFKNQRHWFTACFHPQVVSHFNCILDVVLRINHLIPMNWVCVLSSKKIPSQSRIKFLGENGTLNSPSPFAPLLPIYACVILSSYFTIGPIWSRSICISVCRVSIPITQACSHNSSMK